MMPDKIVKVPDIITSACNFKRSFPETPTSMHLIIFIYQVKEYRVIFIQIDTLSLVRILSLNYYRI